ncbi:MAG: hypothetical protein EBS05_07575 [Proteobacteria bacterium]|nr:hypothetical protein [Pseudomonadota bacterium]
MSTVTEIKAAIETLSYKERAELERWLRASDSDDNIPHRPSDIDPDVDSPELEAELLKAADSPLAPYNPAELRAIGERVMRERRAAHVS